MANYREMYLHLMRKTEKALRILIEAQRECEEMYISDDSPPLRVFLPPQAGD